MNIKRGLWIGVDGPDYTGKKTQVGRMVQTLLSWSEDNIVTVTHDPSRRAQEIKKALAKDKDAYSNGMRLAELYTDDRVATQAEIGTPILRAGGILISNRHKPSTDAYQSAQGIPLADTMTLQRNKNIGTPDISFYLVASRSAVEARMKNSMAERGVPLDKFERDLDFQMRVADQYRLMSRMAIDDPAYFGEVHLIDADLYPDVVTRKMADILKPKYDSWLAGFSL